MADTGSGFTYTFTYQISTKIFTWVFRSYPQLSSNKTRLWSLHAWLEIVCQLFQQSLLSYGEIWTLQFAKSDSWQTVWSNGTVIRGLPSKQLFDSVGGSLARVPQLRWFFLFFFFPFWFHFLFPLFKKNFNYFKLPTRKTTGMYHPIPFIFFYGYLWVIVGCCRPSWVVLGCCWIIVGRCGSFNLG